MADELRSQGFMASRFGMTVVIRTLCWRVFRMTIRDRSAPDASFNLAL